MIRDYVIEHYQEAGTARARCPVCNGSDTFTITKHGGALVYNCYRASCDKQLSSGVVFLELSLEERHKAFRERKQTETNAMDWTHPSYWIDGIGDESCRKYMEDKHMLGAYKAGLFRPMYDPAERRFIFPIKDDSGAIIGAAGRSLVGAMPKVLNYSRKYTKPFICGGSDKALLVEDCASAVSATRRGYTGVALMGTHLKKEYIPHLSKYSYIGIALDPDAYSKSFKIKSELDNYIKNVHIVRLNKDIKDMGDYEFNQQEGLCNIKAM